MDKKEVKKTSYNDFHIALILGLYLILDIIILFGLCVFELNGLNHTEALIISFIMEFTATIYLILKGNIKSSLVFYIILLVSPIFIGLLAMFMKLFTENMPFTPTILVLFRNGYTLSGSTINGVLKFMTKYRIPSLLAIIICSLARLFAKKENA